MKYQQAENKGRFDPRSTEADKLFFLQSLESLQQSIGPSIKPWNKN
jgi:hypothetical protein